MLWFTLQSAADSKCASLLNCVNSAFGLLVNMHLPDCVNTVYHSLSEVCCFVVWAEWWQFSWKIKLSPLYQTVKLHDCNPVYGCSEDIEM